MRRVFNPVVLRLMEARAARKIAVVWHLEPVAPPDLPNWLTVSNARYRRRNNSSQGFGCDVPQDIAWG